MAGNDLTQESADTVALLSNPRVLAVDQDPLVQAGAIFGGTNENIRVKHLSDGDVAVSITNNGDTPQSTSLRLTDLGFSGTTVITDIWTGAPLPEHNGEISIELAPADTAMIRLAAA